MSVPDVSGKAIANLEIESLRHVAPTFHGDTIYGETTVLDKRESESRTTAGSFTSRPAATTRTARSCASFRRRVMVPKQSYLDARGGDQPGRPTPADG